MVKLDIRPPNDAGETTAVIRWQIETPAGWIGAYDRAALEQFNLPDLTSKIVNDVCWEVVKQLPERLSPTNFNNFKPALYEGLKLYHEHMLKGMAHEQT